MSWFYWSSVITSTLGLQLHNVRHAHSQIVLPWLFTVVFLKVHASDCKRPPEGPGMFE